MTSGPSFFSYSGFTEVYMINNVCLYEEAKQLESLGFCMAPWSIINGIKKPTQGAERWVNDHKPVEDWKDAFKKADCLAIICGSRSGNVYTIDIDQKNDPTGTINAEFKQRLKILHPDLYDRIYIESSMSQGLHLIFRVEGEPIKKTIPAKGADGRALIEVLGEGQLVIVAPSKGYKVEQGELEELATFTRTEFNFLIEVCKGFNQMPSEEVIDGVKSDVALDSSLPGDDWGERVDFTEYLQLFGWVVCGEKAGTVYLRRPGKTSGVSATWNHGGFRRLWIFSSSTEFQDGKMLKPFHVYAHYEHDGDYKKASKQLKSEGFGDGVDKFKKLFDECKSSNEVKQVIIDNPSVARTSGLDWEEIKMHVGAMDIKKVSDTGLDKIKKVVVNSSKEENWEDQLERTEDENVKPKLNNLKIIFTYDERLSETFKFNLFTKEIWANWKFYTDEFDFRPIDDDFLGSLRIWLAAVYKCDFHATDILSIVRWKGQSETRAFHPVKDIIEAEEWDGVSRLDSWLSTYLGADSSEYTKKVGKYFLIGALNRLYNPGCQMDYTLILEGSQGIGKSTFLRKLSFGYFSDRMSEFNNKDAAIELFGNWIIELAELECLKGKDAKRNKAFLSRPFDKIRLPHDKLTTEHLRSNVFIGTTNELSDYLEDYTGNRRYWPVLVSKVDRDAPVPQLWAEAYQAFRNGEKHYPDMEDKDFSKEQDKRLNRDMREEVIADYMKSTGIDWITLKMIHSVILGNKSDIDWRVSKDLSNLVKKMGMRQLTRGGKRGWYTP